MKQITIEIPESQYGFFLQLMKKLGFNKKNKTDDFVLSPAHKKIVDDALKDMEENPTHEKDWNSIKKNLTAKLRKRK